MNPKIEKEFNSLLRELSCSQQTFETFRDFVEMSFVSLANTVYLKTDKGQELEKRYLDIAGKYDREKLNKFARMLALVALSHREGFSDVLGHLFMSNDLGNQYRGQFFTPYHISQFMAQLQISDLAPIVAYKGFFSMSEPSCGSGGMVIACAEAVTKENLDPSETFWAQAQDIDRMCFMMTYIQLSILGIPARVVLGDTLRMEEDEVLYTPTFIKGNWFAKIKAAEDRGVVAVNTEAWAPEQLEVFANGTLL